MTDLRCQNPQLQMRVSKGVTFHTPPQTPIEDMTLPALTRRAETNLDDVADAQRRRLEMDDLDRTLAAITLDDLTPTSSPAAEEPIAITTTLGKSATEPYGPSMAGIMGQERIEVHPRDSSPSSSIGSRSDSELHDDVEKTPVVDSPPTSVSEDFPAPTSKATLAARSTAGQNSLRLSAKASNRIREHVLRPLLAKASLKEFHSIVSECPKKIHAKELVCLRDLEKTLVFLAPVRLTPPHPSLACSSS